MHKNAQIILTILIIMESLWATRTFAQIPQQTGWITTLQEEYKLTATPVEFMVSNQTLNQTILLLSRTLPENPTILMPTNEEFPIISGNISGNPMEIIQNLCNYYGYQITEKEQILTVTKKPNDNTNKTEIYYLTGERSENPQINPELEYILEKTRKILDIPKTIENTIRNEKGFITGWQKENTVTSQKILYNTHTNTLMVNAPENLQNQIRETLTHLNKTNTPITIVYNGIHLHTQTGALLKIIKHTHKKFDIEQNIWVMEKENGRLIPTKKIQERGSQNLQETYLWVHEINSNTFAVKTLNINNEIQPQYRKFQKFEIGRDNIQTINVNNKNIPIEIYLGTIKTEAQTKNFEAEITAATTRLKTLIYKLEFLSQ